MEGLLEKEMVKRYLAYKDSGIKWLGEIPEHWEVSKLKIISNFINRGITPTYVEYSSIRVINQATFSKGYFDLENTKFTKEKDNSNSSVSKGIVIQGDILLASTGGGVLGKVAFVDFDDDSFQADSHVTIIRMDKENFNTKYYYYILSISFDLINGLLAQGSTNQTELQRDWLRDFEFPVPSFNEQNAITTFLDRKTALIDKAIGFKEKQIELLKERRQILIHRAVTRGINPNVKMKDSGVEWIGEVPEHWGIRHFRRLFTFLNTKRIPLSAEEREKKQGNFPYYGASGIIDYVDDYIFDEPLILIAEDGANLLSKSTPLAFVASGKYWVNNHAHIIKPLYKGFTYWSELLSSVDYTTSISGAAQPKLTMDRLSSIKLPVPPEIEIEEIGIYLDRISQKISIAISLKEQEIEKLKEYKAVLINEAVTGKIKVN